VFCRTKVRYSESARKTKYIRTVLIDIQRVSFFLKNSLYSSGYDEKMSFTKFQFQLFRRLYNEALLSVQQWQITFSSLKRSFGNIHFSILPWEGLRRIFRKKWNSMKIDKNHMNVLSFSSGFRIAYFYTTEHWLLTMKRLENCLNATQSGILKATHCKVPPGPTFFRDIFMSFYSSMKIL